MLDEKDLQAIAQLINQSVTASESRMKEEIRGVKVIIESDIKKDIQTIAEGHKIIIDRLPEVDEQVQLKSRVRVLERVVLDLRQEVEDLKKAN